AYHCPTFLTSPVGTSVRSPYLNDPRRDRGAPLFSVSCRCRCIAKNTQRKANNPEMSSKAESVLPLDWAKKFGNGSAPFLQRFFHFPIGSAPFQIFPLVVQGFPFCQSHFQLYFTFFQVNLQGNEGIPAFLGLTHEALDFPLMEQELPHPFRIVVELVAERVRADVGVKQKRLPVFDFNESCRAFLFRQRTFSSRINK
ncbi:MAG: hypothetical protein H6Q42_1289, partial [Deltaproteobacteria bacterium]|nr:hypothetical protein [Deltaproteobacteria bacterium]